MAVTIKEIAAVAKVSRGTVDRVLNNRGGVKPEVESRIKTIAEKLGYKPNSAAKAFSMLKKRMVFGVLLPSISNLFFIDLINGIYAAQKELEDYGVKIILKEMQGYDVDTQLQLIDELLAQDITAFAFLPLADERIVEKINEIVAKGIFVATVNSDIENSSRTVYVGTDFVQSGRLAAGLMGLINNSANVLIVSGSAKLLSHNQRIDGFSEVVNARFPDIKILEILECNDNDFIAYDLVSEALGKYKDINAVYLTAEGIKGACEAISKFPNRKINVVCFDDVPHIIELINEGKINATICQQPFRQGYEAVMFLFDKCAGLSASESDCIFVENIIKLKESF